MNDYVMRKLQLDLIKKITKGNRNDLRYIYNGIYHDKNSKKAVVTDGRIMFVSSLWYDKNLANLIIDTEELISMEGKFPDYEKVIWDKSDGEDILDGISLVIMGLKLDRLNI